MAEEQAESRGNKSAADVLMEGEKNEAEVELIGDAMYMNYRQLQLLPQRLFDSDVCAVLHLLYLKHNLLQSLPPEIKLLQHLTELYLQSNSLKTLPEELGELTQLQTLGVSSNQLASFPQCICHLQNLRRLQLSRNQLTHLPADVGKLEQLQSLEVSHNRLRQLPSQLSCCVNLRQLCVDSNQLVSIPRQLCQLTQLSEISACDNLLLSLPQDLGNIASLQAVYVDNNPFLTAVPASILPKAVGFCGSGKQTIPDHLLRMHHHIKLKGGQEEELIVPMPPEIRSLGQFCADCVPCWSFHCECCSKHNKDLLAV